MLAPPRLTRSAARRACRMVFGTGPGASRSPSVHRADAAGRPRPANREPRNRQPYQPKRPRRQAHRACWPAVDLMRGRGGGHGRRMISQLPQLRDKKQKPAARSPGRKEVAKRGTRPGAVTPLRPQKPSFAAQCEHARNARPRAPFALVVPAGRRASVLDWCPPDKLF